MGVAATKLGNHDENMYKVGFRHAQYGGLAVFADVAGCSSSGKRTAPEGPTAGRSEILTCGALGHTNGGLELECL